MFYENTLGIWVFLIIQNFNFNNGKEPLDDPAVRLKFSQFHCYKLKICTPGGEKVCGFDEYAVKMAEFEDMCTMHKVNCEGIGLYLSVERELCTRQKEYEEQNNITNHFSKFTTKPSSEYEPIKFIY